MTKRKPCVELDSCYACQAVSLPIWVKSFPDMKRHMQTDHRQAWSRTSPWPEGQSDIRVLIPGSHPELQASSESSYTRDVWGLLGGRCWTRCWANLESD